MDTIKNEDEMKESKSKSSVNSIIGILICAMGLPFILWNVCFGFIAGYLILAGFLVVVLFLNTKTVKRKMLFVMAAALLYLSALPLTLWQYQAKSKAFYLKIESGQQLKLNEKISIYGLNLTMGLVAFPVYPEVARETLYLCIPARNEMRTFKSNFFLKSRKIRRAIVNNEERITWSAGEFALGHEESRFALALNPCTLHRNATENGSELIASVDVRYSKKFEVILISKPVKISVEEGLFWYLQEINWLHPYRAQWVTTGSFSAVPSL